VGSAAHDLRGNWSRRRRLCERASRLVTLQSPR
jgi:hypothetical protein